MSANISAQEAGRSANVVIVAIDGVRWQDVFGAGRDTLMPFLWNVMAAQGQIFGNRELKSPMRVTNRLNFSYPGYQEMLAGYVDPRINQNTFGPNPNATVLGWLADKPEFRLRVAALANWVVFRDILAKAPGGMVIRAGGPNGEEAAPDGDIHRLAMQQLAEHKPRVLFVGYGETDAWAHAGQVDRYRGALRAADGFVADLWRALQSAPEYRDRTTLIVTTDHGRGRGRRWSSHGRNVRGSSETWLAIMGPGTPALGERRNTREVATAQVAATIAAALGYDYRAAVPRAASAIPSR